MPPRFPSCACPFAIGNRYAGNYGKSPRCVLMRIARGTGKFECPEAGILRRRGSLRRNSGDLDRYDNDNVSPYRGRENSRSNNASFSADFQVRRINRSLSIPIPSPGCRDFEIFAIAPADLPSTERRWEWGKGGGRGESNFTVDNFSIASLRNS